jgi:hypothetical protein
MVRGDEIELAKRRPLRSLEPTSSSLVRRGVGRGTWDVGRGTWDVGRVKSGQNSRS